MKHSLPDLIEAQRNVHVLYSYDEMDKYLQNVLAYIIDSVRAEENIILIENERIYIKIKKELHELISKEEMEYIHFINSFDFYFSSGSYHPPAITAYFEKTVQPYIQNNKSFRSWAHVEWTSVEEPHHLIHDFENIIDDAVKQIEFPLVCAYKQTNMPIHLKTMLNQLHPFILEETSLSPVEDSLTVKPSVLSSN
ncbi:MEDS domain-containing protein [Jeotgalibacillus salarius]|uniref:MEDS domain-containing protein n=1 Tax=Jeotgalibacillus salarius TaxID=546023 RepID=A0A4Y8LII2_9BACL|nr:MEDS domain-containing protein [Jeotgalibacillus salarius]TFE02288.1 hypothetical protein E2626_06830 [Jeotgalibacillus salarius]